MIADFFIDFLANSAGFFLGLFPQDFTVPEWFGSFIDFLNTTVTNGANLGVWIPWTVLFTVGGGVLGYWLVLTAVKGVRWVLNWIPTWGGS